MAELGTAYVQIMPDMSKFSGSLSRGVNSATAGVGAGAGRKFSAGFLDVVRGSAIGAALGGVLQSGIGAITSSMGAAIARVDTLNAFPRTMQQMGIDGEAASASIQRLSEGIDGLPTTLDTAALGVQRFVSANGDIDRSTEYFLALNNAIMAGGAPMANQQAALEQLAQAYAKGKPDMMEWRSLQTAMPAQLRQVADSFGMTTTELGEALREGELSMDEFMDKLVEMNQTGSESMASLEDQARTASGGIATAWGLVGTRVGKGVAKVIEAIGQQNIAGAINAFSSNVINHMFDPLIKGIERFKQGVDVERLVAPFSGVADAMAGINDRVDGAFLANATVFAQQLQKIADAAGPVAEALAGALPGAVEYLGDVLVDVQQLSGGGIVGLLEAVGPSVGPVLESLGAAWGSFRDEAKDAIERVGEALGPFVEKMAENLPGIIDSLSPVADKLVGILGEGLADAIEAVTPLIDPMCEAIRVGADAFSSFLDAAQPLLDTLVPFAPAIVAAFLAFNGAKSAADAVGGIAGTIETLGSVLPMIGGLDDIPAALELITGASGSVPGAIEGVAGALAFVAGNPVVAIVALAAVAAGLAVLWLTNEDFRNFVTGCWEGIKGAIGGACDWLSDKVGGFLDWITGADSYASSSSESIEHSVSDSFQAASSSATGYAQSLQAGVSDSFGIASADAEAAMAALEASSGTHLSAADGLASAHAEHVAQVSGRGFSRYAQEADRQLSSANRSVHTQVGSSMQYATSAASTISGAWDRSYTMQLRAKADTSSAEASMDGLFKRWNNRSITLRGNAQLRASLNGQVVATEYAAGGIRYHADGFIANRAQALDVVGEDGAEAIIPLTNRKYVRPFAGTVAEELAGSGRAARSRTTSTSRGRATRMRWLTPSRAGSRCLTRKGAHGDRHQ